MSSTPLFGFLSLYIYYIYTYIYIYIMYIYAYIYIYYICLSDHFEEGELLKGGKPPSANFKVQR